MFRPNPHALAHIARSRLARAALLTPVAAALATGSHALGRIPFAHAADLTIWISEPTNNINHFQTLSATYTCPADYPAVGNADNSLQIPFNNQSSSGVSATMDGGGYGSASLTVSFTNWNLWGDQTYSISLACHGPGSNPRTDPTGGGTFTFHKGATMSASRTYAIFWRPTHLHYEGPWFAEVSEPDALDQRYENLLTRFLSDVGGSSYYSILTQYSQPNALILNQSTFSGSWEDTSAYPHAGTPSDPLQDADIQAEVGRAIAANGWQAGPNSMFFVYTAWGTTSCGSGCSATPFDGNYCAYHGSFTDASGQPVIYANMPDAGTAALNCGPTGHDPNGDYYADQEVSVTAHELFEAVSDRSHGWSTDGGTQGGTEIGDLCNTDFPGASGSGGNVVLNGHSYIVQSMYSKADNSCVLGYGGLTDVNDTDPGITYVGNWGYYPNRTYVSGPHNGVGDFQDDVHATTQNGDSFDYVFQGTGISYITERSADEGQVDIYVDGVPKGTLNCWMSTLNVPQQVVYSISGLPAGRHIFSVFKRDGTWMLLDALAVQH
jgi:hypothetical protein